MGSGPSGCWCCGGWWTAWKASGCVSWRAWMPGARLGPTTAPRPPPPPAGCEVGSTWAPAPPPAPCGPPKPCSPAPHHNRPGPMRRPALGRPRQRRWPTAPTTPRPHHGRGRAGAGGRGPPAGPTRLRRAIGHLHLVADPEGASSQAERRHGRRGLWLAPTWEGMVAPQGLLDPEAGHILLAALAPWPAPTTPTTPQQRPAPRRRPDRAGPPPPGGRSAAPDRRVRPQLTVIVDLDSLLGHQEAIGRGAWLGGAAGARGVSAAGL